MPNGSLLTRQSPFDGRLYHAASRIWYNNRRAVIIPRLWPRRYAGAARFRPDGRLYHTASRIWYNNRRAVIMPRLWPRRYAGAARFRPDGRLYHAASRTWYNNRRTVIIPSYGQGDTRARPASALMADYTTPLRGHGIIYKIVMQCRFARHERIVYGFFDSHRA